MNALDTIRSLWQHAIWADERLLAALRSNPANDASAEAMREFAHILGADEIWLARLEQRPPRAPVWPAAAIAELEQLVERTHTAFQAYLAGLRVADLAKAVTYRNSAGDQFTNSAGDILLHAALHGQYHRGKVNLLLRQGGSAPAPVDFIAFVRGAPAATKPTGGGTFSSAP